MASFDKSSLSASVIYNPTKLVFGKDCFRTVGKTVKDLGYSKMLVVIGMGHVRKSGLLDLVIESLRSNGIDYVMLEGITPNPEIGKVREGCNLILKHKCDSILALGGGSVIDASKAMSVVHEYPDPWELYKSDSFAKRALPIIACLTISATGSEMNAGSVVTNLKEGLKLGKRDPAFFPKVAFLDPTHQKDLSKYETNNGFVDTIVHLCEAMLASTDGEKEDLLMSIDGAMIRSCIKARDQLEADFSAYEPRANFCLAATFALNGVGEITDNFGCWATHNLQHNVGAFFHKCSHGAGLGVIMPSWILFCERTGKRNIGTLRRLAKEIFGEKIDTTTLAPACDAWRKMLAKWGHPTTLREYLRVSGYPEDATEEAHGATIKKLVDGFMHFQKSKTDLGLTEADLKSIYEGCW